MNFSTAEKVGSVIATMKNAEAQRAPNRGVLNQFFNGDPPWTEQEAKDNGILVNYNDKQAANLLHVARNQYENAFSKTGTFHKITVDCPADKQLDISTKITNHMNGIMRNSAPYYYTQDNVWGGVVLHGVGAKVWWDEFKWRSGFIGIQDILIPTDTDLVMDNLRYFALRRGMRPGQLFLKTLGKKRRPGGWNIPRVKKILDSYKDLNTNPQQWDWSNNPEQMTELFKQNLCYYDGDSAPMVWFWDFYHREEENEDPNLNGWYRKIMLDPDCVPSTTGASEPAAFVYDGKKPFATNLGNIIHFQFGDGNNVPPFKYHSIRSMAWLLYDLVWIMNRLNCQFTQHVFEQLMLLFRVQDPADRDRLQKLILQGIVGVIPDGLNMVTAQERYQVDAPLVQGLMANLKQRVGDFSSQYTQNLDNGTQKERTKFETQAVLGQLSALMSSMLGRAYRQERFAAVETCRRFTIRNNPDFEVKKFQNLCREDRIDPKYLNVDRWEVEIEQVLGGGNRTLEIAEASELMGRINLFDPNAQQEIKHDFVLAVTNNPRKAARLAPLDARPKVTDAIHDAQQSFGTLMFGADMEPKEGLNHIEQVETLLRMLEQVISRIAQTGGVGTPQDIVGIQAVAKYIAKHIALIAKDENEKPRVKAYTDKLSKLMNDVRAFVQRQAEAAKKQGSQVDPEVIAKIQGQMAELQMKLKSKDALMKQSLAHKQMKFDTQMRQQERGAALDATIKTGQALADTMLSATRNGAKPATPFEE